MLEAYDIDAYGFYHDSYGYLSLDAGKRGDVSLVRSLQYTNRVFCAPIAGIYFKVPLLKHEQFDMYRKFN